MNSTAIVHIVDDDEAIREGLCALLGTVAVEARAYATATAFLESASPGMNGCLVVDVRMPGMSGLELQQALKQRGIEIPIIVISGHGDVPMAVRAMKAGAIDFLLKPFNEQDLLDRVLDALNSNDQESRRARVRQEAAARFASLTPRELQVLTRIMACQHSKSIAFDLHISEKTVDVHRYNIMHKTGTRNLSELVQLRLMSGDAP
ncbi:MAG: response regulator transcription factor [Thiobacillus sp.]|nr:response regulator transcription factor [Thiobacillus sp.]